MQPISSISLHLLGRFAVFPARTPDQPLSISSRKGRALLAYVAMQPEPTVSREQLATLLWGDRFDTQARQSLRQCLTTGRQCLARRADVDIPPAVEPELGPGERTVISLAHVPHGDVRDDAGADDKGQELAP
jgi:DNA-binding SARP family transcriptional activator